MSNEIILLNDISDFEAIPKIHFKNKDTQIFVFRLDVHQKLEKEKIIHKFADDFLNKNERVHIFDKGLELLEWSTKISSESLEFEGVNLLKLFDTHEFHSYLMPNLIKFILIKRIVENEKPSKIIATSFFKKAIQSILDKEKTELIIYENLKEKKLLWEDVTIKSNFIKIPIWFTLSKKNFLKIKQIVESLVGLFYNIWLDTEKSKKTIVILEFNPELWEDLLNNLKNYEGNIVLVNQRGSAIASRRSINLIKNSNIKVLDFHNFLQKSEKQKTLDLANNYSQKMESFLKDNQKLKEFFLVENCDFWNVIKDIIIKRYREKLPELISSVLITKKLFENLDIRCIVSLNEAGETEKTFLEFNNRKKPSILFDHGFIERVDETKRFDKLLYVNSKDRMALWGNVRKEYLIKEHAISSEKILVTGSPKHDIYFKSRIQRKKSDKISVLIAPNPITEISGLATASLELRFEDTLKQIIRYLKKIDVEIIIKLHQIQQEYNHNIQKIIKNIDENIPILIVSSVIDAINNSDVVLVISSESFGTSTMLMESMILGKPTMNIVLDNDVPQFTHVKEKAILVVSDNENLELNLKKIIFDTDFQNQLIKNADKFIKKFLENPGNASEKCASILRSF